MNALIIYDSFAAAAKANATLKHSTDNLAFDVQWNIKPWRVDMLKFPPTAEEALTEALDAHLIVLAGRIAQPLPAWLLTWLEHWAKCRHVGEAAMAVFGIGKAVQISLLATSNLADFAKQHGLGLFYVESDELEDGQTIGIGSVRELTSGMPPVPQRAMAARIHESFQQ
jgi:hypothetical protein